MNIRRLLTAVVVAVALLALSFPTMAFDLNLKKKKVNGVEYYYYKVKKGESLYGIAKALGITVDEIVSANPGVADGVTKNDVLLFPVDVPETETVAEEPAPADTAVAPVAEHAPKRPAVALLLPFGLKNIEPTRRNRLSLDFYKGFLLAADSLRDRREKIEIIARDTEGLSEAQVAEMVLTDTALTSAAVYVGPDDEAALSNIAAAAVFNRTYVLNVLNIKDTTYVDNPWMLQGNAPQHVMYRLAVDGLMAGFPGYRPVILRSRAGRNEKEGFVTYLTERYRADGTEPLVVEYDTNLLNADLEQLPAAGGEKYVFVPTSGSLAEFNRFAYVLRSYRDRLKALAAEAFDTAAENGTEPAPYAMAEVFGYPDWTAFRGDALDMLHRLEATVYSRFLDNFTGFDATSFAHSFRSWYGTSMIESVPTQALLGFDAACCIIKNLRANDGVFDPLSPSAYEGVQSSFCFERAGEGFANSSLYIIRFAAGGRQEARVL